MVKSVNYVFIYGILERDKFQSRYEKKYHEEEAERAEEFFRRQESRSTGGGR